MLDTHLDNVRHKRQYEATKLPITVLTGTPYPCTQQQISDYEQVNGREIIQFMSLEETTVQLTEFLDPKRLLYRHEVEALHRLSQARWDQHWSPDIIVKVLPDIDAAFFNNRLRGNLVVFWSDADTMGMRYDTDQTNSYGTTQYEGGGNCKA